MVSPSNISVSNPINYFVPFEPNPRPRVWCSRRHPRAASPTRLHTFSRRYPCGEAARLIILRNMYKEIPIFLIKKWKTVRLNRRIKSCFSIQRLKLAATSTGVSCDYCGRVRVGVVTRKPIANTNTWRGSGGLDA